TNDFINVMNAFVTFSPTGQTGRISTVAHNFASSVAEAIAAQLSNMFAISMDGNGNNIADGGRDMYDNGNYINIVSTSGRTSRTLSYTQSTTASSTSNGDIDYLT
ncbi:hypothetical protein CYMTET_33069, partial [Cymbomonas tetramitiformis]